MVKYSDAQLNEVFGALSDPTRRAIVERLARGEQCVGELAAPFDMSGPAVTKHLHVLERAGLLGRTKLGRQYRCKLNPEPLNSAAAWIEKHRTFWDEHFDALAKYFDAQTPKIKKRRKSNE